MSRRPYGAACDVWGARHDPRRVPARPPQAQNDRPHFGDFECSGRPREVEWPDQDHARRFTCLPGHCTALAWPGDAVVAAVMAPVEGKNAKMTKSLSGSRTGPGGKMGLLCEKIRIFF